MKFVNINLKFGNMKKEQEFTLYPLLPSDRVVAIQSDQRWAEINIETGKGFINKKGHQYANSFSLRKDPLPIELTTEQRELIAIACKKMIGNTNSDGSITLIGESICHAWN